MSRTYSRRDRRTLASRLVLVVATGLGVVGLVGCADRTPAATAPVPSGVPASGVALAGAASAPDIARYCQLSDQLAELEGRVSDPAVFAQRAAPQLSEISRVAPAQIREAVAVYVADTRAAGNVAGVTAPDDAAVTRADSTLDTFEEANCQ